MEWLGYWKMRPIFMVFYTFNLEQVHKSLQVLITFLIVTIGLVVFIIQVIVELCLRPFLDLSKK